MKKFFKYIAKKINKLLHKFFKVRVVKVENPPVKPKIDDAKKSLQSVQEQLDKIIAKHDTSLTYGGHNQFLS